MANETLLPNEETIIKDIIKKKDTIQKARNLQERGWLVNIAYLYGKVNFIADSRKVMSGLEERLIWELKSEDRKGQVKRTGNYIFPLYRSLLARLLMMKSHTSVEPTTNSDVDKSAARVGNEVLEDFWQMCNKNNPELCQKYAGMLVVLSKAFAFALTTGRSYLYPYFNAKTNAKYFLDEEVSIGEIGEVETQVLNQFDVFEDPLGRFKIIQRVMSVEAVKQQYEVEVKAEDLSLSDAEHQLLTMLEGKEDSGKIENGVRVFEYWETPSEKYPQGRYVITTTAKLILDDVIPPEYKNRIPLFSINYIDLAFSSFPQGMVDQLISLQEEYNFTLTKIHSYKKWLAGKLKVPKGAKLEVKYDDEIGQIVYYVQGQEPHWEVPPNPPTYLWDELVRIRKDMEDIAGIHDSSMGRMPQQIKSGIAIENLSELDNSQLSPVLLNIEQQLSFFAETVLDIIEVKYTEPRILNIVGENEGVDVNVFLGKDVSGNRRIQVSIGTNLPMGKMEKQQFIMGLAAQGYIDKAKALELMEFNDLSGLYNSIDEQAQKAEISEILKGEPVEPNEWDNHQAHIKIIEQYIKGEKFKKIEPQSRQGLLQHRSLHQKFLRAEMMAASRMNQGQPQGE